MPAAAKRRQYTVCGLRSAVYRLPSTVCRLPSAVCRLPSTVYRLRSAVCGLPSTVYRLPSTVYRLPSTIHGPRSTVHGLLRAHRPASPVFCETLLELRHHRRLAGVPRERECFARGGDGGVELPELRVRGAQGVERRDVAAAREIHGAVRQRQRLGAVADAGVWCSRQQ